jgi:two-component system chemotaxis response regulator CheB
LLDDPINRYRNRTIDALFRSVAAHAGSRMVGVVLSGSLDDGSRGLAAIKAAGGTTMVLTPHWSGGKGMPENAVITMVRSTRSAPPNRLQRKSVGF